MEGDPIQIRKVRREQISEIAELWLELKEHRHQRTTNFSNYYQGNTFELRKSEWLSIDKLAVFVADSGPDLLGFCVVSILGNLGEIDSLYIKPVARKQQLGKQLMYSGMAWLEQHNPRHIRLLVGEGNEEVLSFYKQFGFAERAIQMEQL